MGTATLIPRYYKSHPRALQNSCSDGLSSDTAGKYSPMRSRSQYCPGRWLKLQAAWDGGGMRHVPHLRWIKRASQREGHEKALSYR